MMAYERLTVKDIRTGKCERIGDPTTSAVYYINDRFGKSSLDEEVKTKRISFKEVYNRLAELEDMIESGQAVILQAKIGDWVYGCAKTLSRIIYGKIYRIDISGYFGTTYHVYENDGKDLYLLDFVSKNKEAAEAKLKELRGE